MVFNGHTQESIDALDESIMNDIVVMYADGIIGNRAIIPILGSLVTGVFNYIRPQGSSPYSLKSIIGNSYGYIYEDIESNPNDSLLLFMTQAQGFSLDRFKKE